MCRMHTNYGEKKERRDSRKKETRIQTEDQKIVHMALGNMPFVKQNFSLEKCFFVNVLKIISEGF